MHRNNIASFVQEECPRARKRRAVGAGGPMRIKGGDVRRNRHRLKPGRSVVGSCVVGRTKEIWSDTTKGSLINRGVESEGANCRHKVT